MIGARWHVQEVSAPKGRGVNLKILYRNPQRLGEAGMKLVPDQSQRAEEKNILEQLGFTVVEITSVPFAQALHLNGALPRT